MAGQDNGRQLRHFLRMKAYETAAEIEEEIPGPVHEVGQTGKAVVVVLLYPPEHPQIQRWLRAQGNGQVLSRTACERDLLAALEELGAAPESRFVKADIMSCLVRRVEEGLGELHGESTVDRALAKLVSLGLLLNDHDRRGYGVA
jgi:hypothetical protein